MTVLPHRGDMHTASCEDVTPRSSLLRTHSPIPDGSSILRPWPRARSLCRLLPVPAANGIFPTLSLQIFPRMPGPLARRYREVLLPVSSSASSAFPNRGVGRLPATTREIRLLAEAFFVAADISLCSSLRVCSPPRSFLPLRILPQGSRDFYIRAHRASLPPHVPDMLAVRRQVIDGAKTFTLPDPQPCRLLPLHHRFSLLRSQCAHRFNGSSAARGNQGSTLGNQNHDSNRNDKARRVATTGTASILAGAPPKMSEECRR